MSINNSSRIFCAKGCIGNGGSRVKKFFFFYGRNNSMFACT